jgi:hypothetical protein
MVMNAVNTNVVVMGRKDGAIAKRTVKEHGRCDHLDLVSVVPVAVAVRHCGGSYF